MDINLQTYKDSKGYIITREVFRSGQCIDERNIDRRFVKELYENTKKNIIDKGIIIPIKLTHNDNLPVSRGYVKDIRLKGGFGAYRIYADIFLYQDTFDVYRSGRIPSCSIEIAMNGYSIDGKEFGHYIEAIALGAFTPAQPDLNYNAFKDSVFCFSVLPKKSKEQLIKTKGRKQFTKEATMDEKQVNAFQELMKGMYRCMEAFGMTPEMMMVEEEEEKEVITTVPADGEHKPEGYSKQINELIKLNKSLVNEVNNLKNEFNKSKDSGKPSIEDQTKELIDKKIIDEEDKEDFIAFAKVTNFDKAKKRFSKIQLTESDKEPPENQKIPSDRKPAKNIFGTNGNGSPATESEYREFFRRAGRTEKEIDGIVKFKKEKEGVA